MRSPQAAQTGTAQQDHRLQAYSHFGAPVHALLALDAGRMGSWSLDIETSTVVGDRRMSQFFGLDFDAQPWPLETCFSAIDDGDLAAVQASVQKALSGETDNYDTAFRVNPNPDSKTEMWLGARGQVTEWAEDGRPLRLVGVNWDATAQQQGEAKLAALAAEMDHRIKNAFSVIIALLNIGHRRSSGKEDFATTLRAQVEAMATAHSLSARMARKTQDSDTKLSILEIIEASLAPWLGHTCDSQQRVSITCDAALAIPPLKVSALAMILYEMSTNAAKHGALSGSNGKVDVTVVPETDAGLVLTWSETGIDYRPHLQSDAAEGFGTVLLQHCAQNLGGTLTDTELDDGHQTILRIDLGA